MALALRWKNDAIQPDGNQLRSSWKSLLWCSALKCRWSDTGKLVGQKSGVNPNIFYLPATNDADDGYQGDYDGDFNGAIRNSKSLGWNRPALHRRHARIISGSNRQRKPSWSSEKRMCWHDSGRLPERLMTAEKAVATAYGMIAKDWKNLAKERLRCCATAQLNRALESRTNKRPLPSDSRDTGRLNRIAIIGSGSIVKALLMTVFHRWNWTNPSPQSSWQYRRGVLHSGKWRYLWHTDQQSAEMRRRERGGTAIRRRKEDSDDHLHHWS